MKKLDKLISLDEEVFKLFQDFIPVYKKFVKDCPIPLTAGVFLMFITNTNFIKESILELAENEECYSIYIVNCQRKVV